MNNDYSEQLLDKLYVELKRYRMLQRRAKALDGVYRLAKRGFPFPAETTRGIDDE